jgi:CHAD domain-containing protein
MPYRFKLDESIKNGFRRIAREQIELAVSSLDSAGNPAASVHASRKALKRLRALIRCCTPALGAKTARKHDVAIRDIARLMSAHRDRDVLHNTLGRLEDELGISAMKAFQPLRARLAIGPEETSEPLNTILHDQIVTLLRERGEKINKTGIKGRNFSQAIAGIEADYRKGQKALKAAYAKPCDEAMHELRKAVQTHWRQMALLSRAWPEEFAARVAASRELSQLLGDDHDIAVVKLAAAELALADRSLICGFCEQRQSEIRADVEHRSHRLFAEPAVAFGRRMEATWRAGRSIKSLATKVDMQAKPATPPQAPSFATPKDGSQPRLAAKTLASTGSQRQA